MNEDIMTIPTLMKLLVIRIVPNNLLGFRSVFRMACERFVPLPVISERSDGDREKKATSDPEITAEPISRTTTISMAANIPPVTGEKVTLIPASIRREYGSVSNSGIGLMV